jgi:hypothetical protein
MRLSTISNSTRIGGMRMDSRYGNPTRLPIDSSRDLGEAGNRRWPKGACRLTSGSASDRRVFGTPNPPGFFGVRIERTHPRTGIPSAAVDSCAPAKPFLDAPGSVIVSISSATPNGNIRELEAWLDHWQLDHSIKQCKLLNTDIWTKPRGEMAPGNLSPTKFNGRTSRRVCHAWPSVFLGTGIGAVTWV